MPICLLYLFKTIVYKEVSLQLHLLEFFFDQKYNFFFLLFFLFLFMFFFMHRVFSNFSLIFLIFLSLGASSLFYRITSFGELSL